MRFCLPVLLALLAATPGSCRADATLKLQGTTLILNDRGCVTSLRGADGEEYAPPGAPPAFEVETDAGILRPTMVHRVGASLVVTFGDRGRMRLAVSEARGFALLKLVELSVPGPVKRLQLFRLRMKQPATLAGLMNSSYNDRFAAAVMATEINVRAQASGSQQMVTDNKECSHQFERVTDEVKDGKAAARFSGLSRRDDNVGWCSRRSPLPTALDLTGCRAVRAWVYGDGSGAILKIQLRDPSGGARDDTFPLDFTGWRQVTLAKPSYNTLRYGQVNSTNFYLNSMPARKRVTCLIDQVEALVGEGDGARVVPLESFEEPQAPVWGITPFNEMAAESFAQHGIQPAGVGIIACPRNELIPTIERFERAAGLPSPHPGGVWSKASPRARRSYLLAIYMTEADADQVIAFAKRGGFDTVMIFQAGGMWCATTGHYQISTKAYPRGLESLRDVVARMHRAGLKVGLHYLGASIYPPDPYVAPVPDPRLVRDASAELGAGIDEKASFIPTAGPPEGFPAKDIDYLGSGAVLQVGDELIHYTSLSTQPPFGFQGCARGFHGTQPAAHAKGERVAHMHRAYGYYLYDMDTPILGEVADNVTRIINTCGFDMVYWDGSEQLQGDHWYYNAKLHKAFYDRIQNKDVLCQGSSVSHYSWHIHSRLASADGHGDLKGYLDERSPRFTWYADNLLPVDIGWYSVLDTTQPFDAFEYILNKSVGFDASISFGITPQVLRTHPFVWQIADRIAAYERVRTAGKVPAATREALRVPKRDYRLVEEGGKPFLQRVLFEPAHDVVDFEGRSNVWRIEVKEKPCRLAVELETSPDRWAGPSPAYRSPKALPIEVFETLRPYLREPDATDHAMVIGDGKAGMTREGVTQRFESAAEGAPGAGRCALYTAASTLDTGVGWAAIGRRFDPPLDLSWHKGIGFWMRGDGHGGAFKLQLRDGAGATDYYITNNFEGWRYVQLARPEKDPIDYRKVSSLYFYYNSMPAKTSITCGIDDVKALPELDEPAAANPVLEVDGQRLAWDAALQGAQRLFCWPGEPVSLSGPRTERMLPASPEILLQPGKHTVRLACEGASSIAVRARLMLLPPERLDAGEKP